MKKKSFIRLLTIVSVLFLSSGCDFGDNPIENSIALSNKVIVASTVAIDYSAGNAGLYSIENNSVQKNIMPKALYKDNSIRILDTTIYLIEKMGEDNVLMIKGHNISSGVVDNQINITDGSNIHDIVFVSPNKAYITVYEGQNLICYDPNTGVMTGKKISLGHLSASGATTPKMSEAVNYNGKAFIGLQMYSDDFLSILDTGALAVVNSVNDSVEKKIVLKKNNPQGMSIFNNILYCACLGQYGQMDGGIVAVDLTTEALLNTTIEESVLGGDVSDVIITSGSKGYAIITDNSFNTALVSFNPSNGQKIAVIAAAGQPSDFLVDEGRMYIASRDPAKHGIIVLNITDDALISGPHDLGLPPNKIAMLNFE